MKGLFSFLLFANISFAQQWASTDLINTQSRYDDVFFLNENLGWAANGGEAKVFKTTDGGLNWDLQLDLSQNYFRNIEFIDENIGFLGTINGSFYKTIDGGTNWEIVSLPSNTEAICGMDAVGTSTVYGCGAFFEPAYLIKSIDSGTTWTYKDMSQFATALVEVLFTTENIGYASGRNAQGGVILKTIDGGMNWTTIYNGNLQGEYVCKLQILSNNPNVMFGSVSSVAPFQGKLIKSVDAGLTWFSKNVPDTDIQAVGFESETHGWMGGHNSGFLETFDSGDTWTDTGIGRTLNRIIFLENNIAYACGETVFKLDQNLSNKSYEKESYYGLNIKINPNPIIDKLNIEIDFITADNLLLELYSMDGKLIKKLIRDSVLDKTKKTYTIDFTYPNGSYILNFHSNSFRQSVKILK